MKLKLLVALVLTTKIAGCTRSATESTELTAANATPATVQNSTHTVILRVPQTPPGSEISYVCGSTSDRLKGNAAWEKTFTANGADSVLLSCIPPTEAFLTATPVVVEIWVDGQLAQQKRREGNMATCEVTLPAPVGYATPTPSNAELQNQVDDLQQQQDRSEYERREDEKQRANDQYKRDQSEQDRRGDIRFKQGQIGRLEEKRRSLVRSQFSNQSPDVVQREIDNVDREIRHHQQQIADIESRP